MFTINHGNMEDNRRPASEHSTGYSNTPHRRPAPDATQRIKTDGTVPPVRRTPAASQNPRPAASQAQRRASSHAQPKKKFDLRRPIYRQLAAYGHVGREDLDIPWEKTDIAADIKKALM